MGVPGTGTIGLVPLHPGTLLKSVNLAGHVRSVISTMLPVSSSPNPDSGAMYMDLACELVVKLKVNP